MDQTTPTTLTLAQAIDALAGFMNLAQLNAMKRGCRGEEGDYFRAKLIELGTRIATMPKTYEQNGKGDEAVAYLRYFAGGGRAAWHITEKDADPDKDGQVQAFGLADLFGDGGELGYISIAEIIACRGELDLHFTPATLGAIRAKAAA